MTLRKFMKQYNNYKNHYDLQFIMKTKGFTYEKLAEIEMQSEEWFKEQ